jgi:hypothetical protein
LSIGTLKTLTLGKEIKHKMNREELFPCKLSFDIRVAKITNRKGIEKIYCPITFPPTSGCENYKQKRIREDILPCKLSSCI